MDLLAYLIPGIVRRQLLRRLWGEGVVASVTVLAHAVPARYAAVHRELAAMESAGLVVSQRSGRAIVYRANREHPQAELLEALAGKETPPGSDGDDDEVRGALRAWGAPLWAPPPRNKGAVEEVLARGLALAHRDPTVALVLPVVIWRHRDQLDHARLAIAAKRVGEPQALGFYLDLTGRLAGNRRLLSAARQLDAWRRRRARPFFARAHGKYEMALTRRNTPDLARRWGFLMNVTMEAFEAAFAKHTAVAA